MSDPDEALFESSICDWLVGPGGYVSVKSDLDQGAARDFDPARGLDTGELYTFVGVSPIT